MAIWQILQRVHESNTTLDTALLNCIAPPPLKRWLVRNRKTQRQHFSVQAIFIKWGKFKTGLTLLSVVPRFILIETWEWKWAHSVLRLLFLLTRGFIPTQETAFLIFFFFFFTKLLKLTTKRGENKKVGKWLSYFVQSFVVNYMNKLNWLREVVRRIHACALSTVAE